MVRNKEAIERYVNLIAIAFTLVSVLPFLDSRFSKYQFRSPQVFKRALADSITKELIFNSFASALENSKIYSSIVKSINHFLLKDFIA